MDDYNIRAATLQDLDSLVHFEQGVISAERPFDPTIRDGMVTYYNLEELIASEDAQVIVIENRSKIIASGYALKKRARQYLNHEFYAYLGFMYTHPKFRGKGLNAIVIRELRDWAISKGLTEIRLTVYNDNQAAIKAYEKVGFKKHIIEMRLT